MGGMKGENVGRTDGSLEEAAAREGCVTKGRKLKRQAVS